MVGFIHTLEYTYLSQIHFHIFTFLCVFEITTKPTCGTSGLLAGSSLLSSSSIMVPFVKLESPSPKLLVLSSSVSCLEAVKIRAIIGENLSKHIKLIFYHAHAILPIHTQEKGLKECFIKQSHKIQSPALYTLIQTKDWEISKNFCFNFSPYFIVKS